MEPRLFVGDAVMRDAVERNLLDRPGMRRNEGGMGIRHISSSAWAPWSDSCGRLRFIARIKDARQGLIQLQQGYKVGLRDLFQTVRGGSHAIKRTCRGGVLADV